MLNINEIQTALKGKFIQKGNEVPIVHLLIDSRKLIFTEDALFIAIRGTRNNSHRYLKEVYDAGIRNFIVEKGNYDPLVLNELKEANVLETENGITALQHIARLHRSQFKLDVIGVTGSNGKTTVKEWIAHILKEDWSLVKNPKSYNSQVGVPLSVFQIQASHQLGIFEAGISEPNEMQSLEEIIQPNWGIFTLLGEAHEEGFLNKSEKLIEKAKLFAHCTQVIYGEEQSEVDAYFQSLNKMEAGKKYFSWSRTNPKADFFIRQKTGGASTQLQLNDVKVQIPFSDEASIWNACTCLSFLAMRGFDLNKVAPRFSDLPVLEMRLQLKEAHLNSILINDSYSADLGSLNIALEFMQQHASARRKTVILSDFLESGKSELELYTAIDLQMQANKVDQLIGIGLAIQRNKNLFHQKEKYFFDSVQQFLLAFPITQFHQDVILLKGARSFAFERISKWLEKKVHQTVFEINLNALVNNLNVYRSLLKPQVKLMAMVKAFSYGTGSDEIARILSFNRVDYLGVAYADEGVALRNAGIKTPIIVMNPDTQSFDTLLKFGFEPEIYHFNILHSLLLAADGEEIGIHLKLDTGMKRLGFDEWELPSLLKIISENPNLKIISVFTHLAASEDPVMDAFTQNQIDQFKRMSSLIGDAVNYPIIRHCLNSGGISRFPDAQFEMVRLGIGLYGVNPCSEPLPLQVIGTLKTVISQIRKIEPEESIGYGRKGHLSGPGKIAVVAIGYADGLDRKLSNGIGYMSVHGKPARIVGNICMDMTMIDITQIACEEGDEVIVFGEYPNIQELSNQIGTIPYEILTGVSQRVKRVYYME